MALDTRIAQNTLETALRDSILFALGARLPSVASIAALRALTTMGPSGTFIPDNDSLIQVVSASTTAFRFNRASTAVDDGALVVKPSDVLANGRWLAWTSPLRFSTVVGGNDATLDQIASGPLRRVILVDQNTDAEDITSLITGASPAVAVEVLGNDPEDATLLTGYLYFTNYHFTIYSISENLRDRREASLGSTVPNDSDPGANAIDGFIKALIGGTNLTAVVDGIRNVRLGSSNTWRSDLGQRRVVRSRAVTVMVTEEFPNAPNDLGEATDITVQAHITTLDQAKDPFDALNYLASGIAVAYPAAGLTQTISAGSAFIGGSAVSYAGSSHAFDAYADTYRDLLPNGTLVFVPVSMRGSAPAVTATALRIGVTTTDGSSVLSDGILAATQATYGPDYDIPV